MPSFESTKPGGRKSLLRFLCGLTLFFVSIGKMLVVRDEFEKSPVIRRARLLKESSLQPERTGLQADIFGQRRFAFELNLVPISLNTGLLSKQGRNVTKHQKILDNSHQRPQA